MVNGTIYTRSGDTVAELPAGSTELGELQSVLHRTDEHPSRELSGTNLDAKYPGCMLYRSGGDKNTIFLEDLGGYYIPFVCALAPSLTLNDVIILSQKGNELTWTDLDGYSFIETGSGLYIRVYEINALYSLWMGGGPVDEAPMYIRLVCNADEEYVDIRTEDVTDFIAAHSGHGLDASARELTVGGAYVSSGCLYMNPLSSFAAAGGDSGCRYLVAEDGFCIRSKDGGSQQSYAVTWGWQDFPWTDEEWASLYMADTGIANISEVYDTMLYQPVGDGYSMLKMDGELWLIDVHNITNMGEKLWSIYTLIPESAAGTSGS